MKREGSIELYRCLLMFGICLLHAINFGGYGSRWMANMLAPCVVGFVFISGWFGINFKWQKVLKLYGVGAYCAIVYGIAMLVWRGGGDVFRIGCFKLTHGYWFLHAYVIMMALSPLVNLAVPYGTGKCKWEILAPLWAVVFIWGFARTLPCSELLPKADGLSAYGGLTLLAIYAGARVVREMGALDKIKCCHFAWLVPFMLLCCAAGAGDYNSPFAFVLAASAFALIRKVRFGGAVGRIVGWMGPSMLSVYLIHCNEVGLGAVKPMEEFVVQELGGCPVVAMVLTAMLLFAAGGILDVPRRILKRVCVKA